MSQGEPDGSGPAMPAEDDGTTARRTKRRRALAVLLLLLAAVAAVVVARRHASPATEVVPAATNPPTPASTAAPFPSKTASDVVSYADHVAVVTAIAETEASATSTPTSSPSDERVVMRSITFRVDTTMWSRPGAPTAPKQLTSPWWGWLLRDGKRTEMIVSGAPAVFIGAQYVMPIAYDGTAYSAIQPFAVFRLSRERIDLEEQDTPLARELADASLQQVHAVFASAEPDPVAVRYRHLLPRARLAAVLAAHAS